MKKSAGSAWFELMRMGTEIMLASGQVIARRVTRLATAKLPLSSRDRREFSTMGSEKIDAGVSALHACAWEIALSAQKLAARNLKQLQALGIAGIPLASKRLRSTNPITSMSLAAANATADAEALVKLTTTALKPAHRRVTANARRLRKG